MAHRQDIGPSPRGYSAMAYDSQKQRAILFGGTMHDVKMFNDPWEQDLTGSTQAVDIGPPPRSRHSMVYDKNRKDSTFWSHSEDLS